MTLAFRTAGAWGAGEGGRLPSHTIDLNFYELLTRVIALEADPDDPRGIDSFTVVGNLLTVNMNDATTEGPFVLPTSTFIFRDEWQPDTTYVTQTFFTQEGALWYVIYNHISGSTFDSGANDGLGHQFYRKVLAAPQQPYDIGLFYPPVLPGDGQVLLQHVAVRAFTIPADFAASLAFLRIATSVDSLILPIRLNDELIGTIDFDVGVDLVDGFGPGQFGSYHPVTSPGDPIVVQIADILTIEAPAFPDPTAAGLSVTMVGSTGSV